MFLKPFVERYLEDQIEDNQEKLHYEIYKLFLKWIEPNLREVVKSQMDLGLRHAAAHASFTFDMNRYIILIRDTKKGKIVEYTLDAFLKKLEDLNNLIIIINRVWAIRLLEFFESLLDAKEINEKTKEIKTRLLENSINIQYMINILEELKVSFIQLDNRNKLRKSSKI